MYAKTVARAVAVCLVAVAGFVAWAAAGDQKVEKPQDPALERAREQVRMLDDLYKTTVVLITDKYVESADDYPAGSAAVALFSAMKKKGWHDVRLVDATDDPIMENNSPQDDFEKLAVKQLKAGQPYLEEVVDQKGQRLLRAATPIPVVSKKCILCHPHYEAVKPGEPIGLLCYKIAIK